MHLNKQKSYGKRYESAEVKVKMNKRKLFYFLSSLYILGIVTIGVLWALGIY